MKQLILTKELRGIVLLFGLCGAAIIPFTVIFGLVLVSIPMLINVPSFTIEIAFNTASSTLAVVFFASWTVMVKFGLGFMVFGYVVAFDKFIQTNRGEMGEGVCAQ
tara:strand:+ start:468 stop:785 length:318 start_codon:yes stop_codon:yes gene_type:complete